MINGLEISVQCGHAMGLRSVCGFSVWVAGLGFGGFWRLGCWILGVVWWRWWWWRVILLVVGRIGGVSSIYDLWLWVCFVVCCGFVGGAALLLDFFFFF